jgi:uroporphyrin-III C-methyltransferase
VKRPDGAMVALRAEAAAQERGRQSIDLAAAALHGALAGEPQLAAGHVWLVGAGPGDPAQLTLQALAALMQSDVVVHDALVDSRILALIPASTERIFAGKRGGRQSIAQADITALLIRLARESRKVVRLKGGDPYVFGRGGEETLALAEAGIPFRVIGGLTSGLAALTAAGIPATLRGVNHAVVLVAGHGVVADEGRAPDWALLAKLGQPLVIYMAVKNIRAISDALREGGLSDSVPAAVIASVGTEAQRVIIAPLAEIAQVVEHSRIDTPAIIVIGEIVRNGRIFHQPLTHEASR